MASFFWLPASIPSDVFFNPNHAYCVAEIGYLADPRPQIETVKMPRDFGTCSTQSLGLTFKL